MSSNLLTPEERYTRKRERQRKARAERRLADLLDTPEHRMVLRAYTHWPRWVSLGYEESVYDDDGSVYRCEVGAITDSGGHTGSRGLNDRDASGKRHYLSGDDREDLDLSRCPEVLQALSLLRESREKRSAEMNAAA